MNVLVTDGETRAALAVTRALGAAGHQVAVCSARPRSLAALSRWCASEFAQAPAGSSPREIAASILSAADDAGATCLLGMTDRTLVSLHGDGAGAPRMPPPAAGEYSRASDKAWLWRSCREWSIPVPRGVVVAGGEFPDSDALAALGDGWVARPACSWQWHDGRWVEGKARLVAGRTELENVVSDDPAYAFPYLVQERIHGPGCGLFLCAHEGRLQAVFSHERMREKPPWGGVSTLCRSVRPPQDLLSIAETFVERAGWSGLAMLEFKRDAASGRPYLLEINARPWGSIALPLAAGVDFVDAWTRPEAFSAPPRQYDEDIRLRWWWGDVDHFYLRAKEAGKSGAGSLVSAFFKALAAGPRAHACDTFRRDDPLPFAGETVAWLAQGL